MKEEKENSNFWKAKERKEGSCNVVGEYNVKLVRHIYFALRIDGKLCQMEVLHNWAQFLQHRKIATLLILRNIFFVQFRILYF